MIVPKIVVIKRASKGAEIFELLKIFTRVTVKTRV